MIILDLNPKILWLFWITIQNDYNFNPLSYRELLKNTHFPTEQRLLGQRLICGSYPEFKWNPDTKKRFPTTFLNAYPEAETISITPANRDDFLTG